MKDITYRRCDYGYIHGSGRCSAQATYRAVFTDGELDRIAAAFADAPPYALAPVEYYCAPCLRSLLRYRSFSAKVTDLLAELGGNR